MNRHRGGDGLGARFRRLDLGDERLAALGMADESGDLADQRDRLVDALGRVEQLDAVAKLAEHVAGGELGVAAGEDQVGMEADDRLGAGGIVAERFRASAENDSCGIGGVDREAGDLAGIGECDQKLIGAQVDRDDPRRRHRPRSADA